jgi:cytochrome c2
MIKIKILILIILFSSWISSSRAQENASTDPEAEFYIYRCAGCHTIGGGNRSGPDLATSIKWSTPDLHAAIKRMEKNVGPLTETEISDLIRFLKDISVNTRIAVQKEKITAKLRADLPTASFEAGKKLFRGGKSLQNGGPSCISCHYFVNEGGSLGVDLTNVKDRVDGVALQSGIENSSYKVMRAIYAKHSVTKEESLHLAEYLSNPEKVDARFSPTADLVMVLAIAGTILFSIFLWLHNRQRKGRMREKLIQKSMRGKNP